MQVVLFSTKILHLKYTENGLYNIQTSKYEKLEFQGHKVPPHSSADSGVFVTSKVI